MIITENNAAKVLCPDDVAKIGHDILKAERDGDDMKEHLWVIGLNTDNTIRYIDLCSLGILDQSFCHPREIFAVAITKRVNSIILMHNHPSGNPEPSPEDITRTKQMKKAGEILGIPVRDHVILGSDGRYASIAQQGNL